MFEEFRRSTSCEKFKCFGSRLRCEPKRGVDEDPAQHRQVQFLPEVPAVTNTRAGTNFVRRREMDGAER
jgi:hypothetical protein